MKRILPLMVAALLLVPASMAGAAELKAKGTMQAYGLWMDNWDFRSMEHGAASEEDFEIQERARIQFEFIANEKLKGMVQLQMGTGCWGNGGFTIGQGDGGVARSTSMRVRRAYLAYSFPDSEVDVTAGYYTVALPSYATANRVVDDELAALAVTAPLIGDTLSILALYGRAFDLNLGYGINGDDADGFKPLDDEVDLFALGFPLNFDSFTVTPYGVYSHVGKDALNGVAAGDVGGGANISNLRGLTQAYMGQDFIDITGAQYTRDGDAWWGGLALDTHLLDPIHIQADFVWGSLNTELSGDDTLGDRTGWYADLSVTYTGLDFMSPQIFFAYGSGDDDDTDNGSERLPFIRSNDTGYGTFYYGYGGAFADADKGSSTGNDPGQWILGLGLTEINYVDKLTHDIYFMYVQGTNDSDALEDSAGEAAFVEDNLWGFYLTDKDHLFEVDLNTQYQIYEELQLILEMGAIFAHFDKDVWRTENNGDNAYKVAFGMIYSF